MFLGYCRLQANQPITFVIIFCLCKSGDAGADGAHFLVTSHGANSRTESLGVLGKNHNFLMVISPPPGANNATTVHVLPDWLDNWSGCRALEDELLDSTPW